MSGCIKKVKTQEKRLFLTDNLQNIVKERTLSLRFSSNFKEGFILADKVLQME